MPSATDELSTMKRGDLIREAKRLGVKPGRVTNVWLREQIAARAVTKSATDIPLEVAPEPETVVVTSPTLAPPAPPPVARDPRKPLPLLDYAKYVLVGMEIQPPLSEYLMELALEPSGHSVALTLRCRIGGVSAHVNPDDVPEHLVAVIKGLTREDFGPAKQRGLKVRIDVENRALRVRLAQFQGHAGPGGEPIPMKPELVNDPAELKAAGEGPPRR